VDRVDMDGDDWKVPVARLEERATASDKALTVATQELHRRLEGLNGEAGRIREILAACVPREIYDRGIHSTEEASKVMMAEFDRKIEALEKAGDVKNEATDARLKVLENASANMAGKTWIGGAIVLVLAAIIAAAIPLLMK